MSRTELAGFALVLTLLGAGWGLTEPLSKIAVSTGHRPLGLIFWQLVVGAVLMGVVMALRGRRGVWRPRGLFVCLAIALTGTLLPNAASYAAIVHLPAGVMAILISLVPMVAFPMALVLGLERFVLRRFVGLCAGLCGVLLLVLPEASLPETAALIWVFVALISVFCYAFEGIYVGKWGTDRLDAVEVLFGASVIGLILCGPLAWASGQFISPLRVWGAPEWALLASSAIHVFVYAGYVWLVGRAGAVFAAQVSYLVTGFGVFWSMLILGESYSPYIWAAFILVLTGIALVQPRRKDALALGEGMGETGQAAAQAASRSDRSD